MTKSTSQPPPSRTADQFVVRLPDGMREKIAKQAFINDRSMNAEIVHRLESSLNLIVDEVSLMTAITVFNGYAEKFNCTVSLSISQKPHQILDTAIKNGNLPSDATVEDLNDPTEALERLKKQKLVGEVMLPPTKRRINLDRGGKSKL